MLLGKNLITHYFRVPNIIKSFPTKTNKLISCIVSLFSPLQTLVALLFFSLICSFVLNGFQKIVSLALTKCFFISFQLMPVWAGRERETNTGQNEWHEGNKNSCQNISQCKNLLYTQCLPVFTWAWTYKGYRIQKIYNVHFMSHSVQHIQNKSF